MSKFSKTKVVNYSSKNILVGILLKKIDSQIAKGEPITESLIIAKQLELPAFEVMANRVLESQKN